MYLFFVFMMLSLTFLLGAEEEHKIIYLIASPRSLSSAFLRSMEARQDCALFHEPSLFIYNKETFKGRLPKGMFYKDTIGDFEELKRAIFEEAAHTHVFIKDIACTCRGFINSSEDLLKDPRVYFIFLVRDPHSILISYNKKNPNFFEILVPRFGFEAVCEIFLEASKKLFLEIQSACTNPPLILFAEELSREPERVMRGFCQHVGIPFKVEALSWKDLGVQFTGQKEWHESKMIELFYHWHGDAIRSTHFSPLRSSQVDENGDPTFEEIENSEQRAVFKEAYLFSLPAYRFFKEATDYHLK